MPPAPARASVLRWHVNHGWDAAGEAIPVSAIPETHRPEVIPHVLPQLGTAGRDRGRRAREDPRRGAARDRLRRARPGARLHVLAIGVSDYGEAARHLDARLRRPGRPRPRRRAAQLAERPLRPGARQRARRRRGDQGGDPRASSRAMRDAMAQRRRRRPGGGPLLRPRRRWSTATSSTCCRTASTPARPTAIEGDARCRPPQFHDEIAAIAAARPGDPASRRLPLRRRHRAGSTARCARCSTAPNVTVFTSSSAGELSVEDDAWQNGAFTEALLEALRRGDPDGDGLIRISDLSRYLSQRVPALTGGQQRPDVEIHFDGPHPRRDPLRRVNVSPARRVPVHGLCMGCA